MANIRYRIPEDVDGIASFIIEGTHRLATISLNDYGFQLSARMAQTYLKRAHCVLEEKQSFDKALLHQIHALKTVATAIANEYKQLESFCVDYERFCSLETKNLAEWISKWLVRGISRGYLGTTSHHLAHKICTFHSMVCSVLVEE